MSNGTKGTIISAMVVIVAGTGVGLLVGGSKDAPSAVTVTKTEATDTSSTPDDLTSTESTTPSSDTSGDYMSELLENDGITCGGDLADPTYGEPKTIGRKTFEFTVYYTVTGPDANKGDCAVPAAAKTFRSEVGFESHEGTGGDYKATLELRGNSNTGDTLWSGELTGAGDPQSIKANLEGVNRIFFVLKWNVDASGYTDLVFGDPKFVP